jgi:hypothetical protein
MVNFIAPWLKKPVVPATATVVNLDGRITSWDDLLQCRSMVRFDYFGKRPGAFWNSKKKGPTKNPTMVFGWNMQGVHAYDLQLTIQSFYDDWVRGFTSVPGYLTWVIHSKGEKASNDRVVQLTENMLDGAPEAIQLGMDEIAQVQQLSREGKRVNRSIRLYAYYRMHKDEQANDTDLLGKTIIELKEAAIETKNQIMGKKLEEDAIDYDHLFTQCYLQGFLGVDNLLRNRFGWQATAMSQPELWAATRSSFSGDAPGECPYVIDCVVNKRGVSLSETIAEISLPSFLVKDANPIFNSEWVKIKKWDTHTRQYKDDYIGVLASKGKFEEWAHEYHQLKAIHDLYECDGISDIEVIAEITPSNSSVHQKDASDMRKNALKKMERLAQTKDYSPSAKRDFIESEQNIDAIFENAGTLRCAFVVLVHSSSSQQLDLDCRTIETNFYVGPLQRERVCTPTVWLQTLPLTLGNLLHLVYAGVGISGMQIEADLRYVYKATELMGLVPMATTQPLDSGGLEFISYDGTPFNVQLYTQERQPHWALIGQQRKAGKSDAMTHIVNHAIARRQPVSIINLPSTDDSSSLRDLCDYHNGNHIDLQGASNSLLAIPRRLLMQGGLTDEVRRDQFATLMSHWLNSLMILGGPPPSESYLSQTVKEILQTAIDVYLDNAEISRRYVEAVRAGFGTPEWKKQPTLTDFVKFLTKERLQGKLPKSTDAALVKDALAGLLLRLGRKADPNTVIGRAIATPATVDVEKLTLNVFSLRNLRPGSEESAVYILSAYTYAMQASMLSDVSHIIIEEGQNLADYEGVLQIIGDIPSRGGKAGIRLGILTNSFKKIASTPEGQVLLDNMQIKLIGSIQGESIESLSSILNIPLNILQRCAKGSFSVNKAEGFSSWCIKVDGRYYFGKLYTPWISKALNASNVHERKCRKVFTTTIPDKHDAIAAFAYYFRACAESNREIQILDPAQVIEYLNLCLSKS